MVDLGDVKLVFLLMCPFCPTLRLALCYEFVVCLWLLFFSLLESFLVHNLAFLPSWGKCWLEPIGGDCVCLLWHVGTIDLLWTNTFLELPLFHVRSFFPKEELCKRWCVFLLWIAASTIECVQFVLWSRVARQIPF